jgi:hypothetical protein
MALGTALMGGCATNPSPDARFANNLAQGTVIIGAPVAAGFAVSRTFDASLRDDDGRLVPVARQEGQRYLVEGAIVAGVTAAVAGALWGYMLYEDAHWAAAHPPPAPEVGDAPPEVGDAPPPPSPQE